MKKDLINRHGHAQSTTYYNFSYLLVLQLRTPLTRNGEAAYDEV